MAFDIKSESEKIVKKLQSDPALLKQFSTDPAAALKKLTGIEIPKDQLDPVVKTIKAQLAAGTAADALGKLGDMFGKK